ncbi:NAD(P)-dependent oxidoreductase [Vibrio lentus]|nr:NAD(P)-dependent oxidoreductase [Vibrio lentus]
MAASRRAFQLTLQTSKQKPMARFRLIRVRSRTLKGLKLGILGLKNPGKCIAQYAQAFGMSVVVWGSQQSRVQAQADGFENISNQEDFFRDVDVLSLHLRLNDATKGCVTASDLQLLAKSDSPNLPRP